MKRNAISMVPMNAQVQHTCTNHLLHVLGTLSPKVKTTWAQAMRTRWSVKPRRQLLPTKACEVQTGVCAGAGRTRAHLSLQGSQRSWPRLQCASERSREGIAA